MRFTWDPAKAARNVREHRVTFEEARTVFDDQHALYRAQDHTYERRLAVTGYSAESRMLFVVFIEVEEDVVRIISARKATPHERKKYENQGPAR